MPAVISAVLLLRTGQNAKIKGDASIAMISVGALAAGYLLMNIFSTSSNLSGDVCSTLFGSTSILTLTGWEVWMCAVLSVMVVIAFVFFYNKIFCVTFDEGFARATGTKAGIYNLIIAIIIAVIIVLAMNLRPVTCWEDKKSTYIKSRDADAPISIRYIIVKGVKNDRETNLRAKLLWQPAPHLAQGLYGYEKSGTKGCICAISIIAFKESHPATPINLSINQYSPGKQRFLVGELRSQK